MMVIKKKEGQKNYEKENSKGNMLLLKKCAYNKIGDGGRRKEEMEKNRVKEEKENRRNRKKGI
jgi:hypothetical protein